MKCLNNYKQEELAWTNTFEVYFGRQNNEILKAGAIRNDETEIQKAKIGTRRDYEKYAHTHTHTHTTQTDTHI